MVTVRSAVCHCTGVVVGQLMAMAVVLSVVTAAVVLPTELWYPMFTAYKQQSTLHWQKQLWGKLLRRFSVKQAFRMCIDHMDSNFSKQ